MKHGIYSPLRSWFSDLTGIGKEPEYFIGSEGRVLEWTGQRDHTDALLALGEIGSFFLPTKAPNVAGTVLVEETVGVATAKLLPDTARGGGRQAGADAERGVRGPVRFRDEEVAAMRSLYPELLGPGRVDPTLALRGANKGTWFGNILNERVRQRVQTAITEGRSRRGCGGRARARRASISGCRESARATTCSRPRAAT